MALMPCRECSQQVSTEARACPHCGVPDPARQPSAPPPDPREAVEAAISQVSPEAAARKRVFEQ